MFFHSYFHTSYQHWDTLSKNKVVFFFNMKSTHSTTIVIFGINFVHFFICKRAWWNTFIYHRKLSAELTKKNVLSLIEIPKFLKQQFDCMNIFLNLFDVKPPNSYRMLKKIIIYMNWIAICRMNCVLHVQFVSIKIHLTDNASPIALHLLQLVCWLKTLYTLLYSHYRCQHSICF